MVCLDEQVAVVRPHLNAMQDPIVSLADFPKEFVSTQLQSRPQVPDDGIWGKR
jgi:hypothetical protein